MSDMKIEIDSSEVQTAKAALGEYAGDWSRAVSQIIAENRKLDRAVVASTDVQNAALDKVTQKIAQLQKNNLAAYWDAFGQRIGTVGDRATEVGATFEKLGTIIKNEAEQAKKYWENFEESIGIRGNRATEMGAGFSALEGAFGSDAQLAAAKRHLDMRIASEEIARRQQLEEENLIKTQQREAQQLDNLRAKYDTGFAAVQKYNQVKSELNTLLESGRMDLAAYEAQLESLTQQFVAFQNGQAVAGNMFLDRTNMTDAQKRLQAFGAGAQNVGYQVADMAVQIQGGTHWLVALGQQGSQTLAIFGMWGAVAGAILAVGAAIGTAYFKTKDGADKLKTTLESFREVEEVFESAGVTLEDSLGGAIDRVEAKFGSFVAKLQEQKVDQIRKVFQGLIDEFDSPGFMENLGAATLGNLPFMGGYAQQTSQDSVMGPIVGPVLDTITQQDTAEGMAEAFADAYETLDAMPEVTDAVLARVMAIGTQMGVAEELVRRQNAEQEKQQGVLDKFTDFYDERNERIRQGSEYEVEYQATLNDQIRLQEIQARYGQDSIQYLEAQQQIAERQLVAEARKAGLSGQAITVLVEQLRTSQELETTIYNQEKAWNGVYDVMSSVLNVAENITGVDLEGSVWDAVSAADAFYYRMQDVLGVIGGIMSAIGNIGFDTIALEAENRALAAGANAAEANVAGQQAVFEERNRGSLSAIPDVMGIDVSGMLEGAMNAAHQQALDQRLAAQNTNDGLMDDLRERERDGKKGGGRKKKDEKTAEEILAEYEREIEQRERLIGVSEEQREILEYQAEIEDKLGDKRSEVTEERILQLAQEKDRIEEAIKAQQEQEQATEQLNDAMRGFVEGAILEVVNGRENLLNVFRDLMRDMVIEVFKAKAMDPFMDYAGSALGALIPWADGGAFHGTSYFAKGDVFNSPTAFQFGGGKLGVMGEAGPEAVMPLKRGPDGKLGVATDGGNGSVVITQHFHISANGDESVKRIIRQESPKIAEQAKMAVLDAKRRGGKFSNAF